MVRKTRQDDFSILYIWYSAVLVNFGSNLLCTFTLQGLQDAFDALAPGRGIAYLFVLYAALCAVSLGFVQHCVPETKGKTLEEIEAMLSG